MKLPLRIELPGERPKSWNGYWAGKHWTVRHKEAKRVHELVWYAVHDQIGSRTAIVQIQEPVRLLFTLTFKRPIDWSNVCIKPYEDGLIRVGLLVDDSYKYVVEGTVRVVKGKEDCLTIDILPANDTDAG